MVDCNACNNLGCDAISKTTGMSRSLTSDDGSSLRGIYGNLASKIDHTLLRPDATSEQIIKLCTEAREFEFASVCVNPYYVALAANQLKGCKVKVCTVVGFPLGASTSKAKAMEAAEAIENGAEEIDMVLNIGELKSRNLDTVRNDIESVVISVKERALVKVILETCLLSEEEKINACLAAKAAGAHFVKTSTGFSRGGATVEDIKLMRQVVGSDFGVKASGGIRDYETAIAMISAGANRIGTSSSVSIIKNIKTLAE